jgi:hypothetical protein
MSSNTVPFQVKQSFSVATDATGAAMYVVVPGCGRFGIAAGVLAAGNFTLAATWGSLAGNAFIGTNFAEVRIVSFGVKLLSTASATNCSGLVHLFNLTSPVVSQVIPQLNLLNTEDKTVPLTAGYQTTWVSKPLGSAAHSFTPLASLTNTMTDFNWTSLGIEIVGGAASQTVMFGELVVNVEGHLNSTALTTTGLGGATVGVRAANPIATAVQAKVQSVIPSFVEGGSESLGKKIESMAASAVDSFADAASYGLGLLFG